MNDLIIKLLVLIAGAVMGVVFFGGLWFTVKKTLTAKQPALWYFGSLILRTGIVLLGFYYVSAGGWVNMLICLLGFVIARFAVQRYVKTNHGQLETNKSS